MLPPRALLLVGSLLGLGGFLTLAWAPKRSSASIEPTVSQSARMRPGERANKAAADHDAGVLLTRLVLPPGTRRTHKAPPDAGDRLAGSGSRLASPNTVDRHVFWIAPASVSETLAFVEAHPPVTSQLTSSGSGIQGGVTTSRFLRFEWPPIPFVLYARSLTVQMVALPGGSTAIRADMADMWDIPRPSSERIPSTASVLDVAVTRPRARPSVSLTVTDPTEVKKIANFIDALPTTQPVAIACPDIPVDAPAVTFTFRADGRGPALAQARESASASGPLDPCEPMSFTLAGRSLIPLLGGATVIEPAQTLLGVTLRRAR
jgi:hypothetical protein